MNKDLSITKSIQINAPASQVWNALTNPEIVKEYLFGTELITDWNVGSDLVFQGSYDGKEYKDKGVVKEYAPETSIEYTYWSSFSGLNDTEDNYSLVSYHLNEKEGVTTLTLTQKGFANEEAQMHSDKNWGMVLEKLKELLEQQNG